MASALAWAGAFYALWHAPWTSNLAFLIDPETTYAQSTWAYLFTFPALLLAAFLLALTARDVLSRLGFLGKGEVAVAAALGLVVFYFAIGRAMAALSLTWI